MLKLFAVVALSSFTKAQVSPAPSSVPGAQAPAAAQAGTDDMVVVHQFGVAGTPGSVLVQFDRRGASVLSVQLTDHYVSPAAAHKEPRDRSADDYQLLVFSQARSLRLWLDQRSSGLMTLQLDSSDGWTMQDIDGAVRFTISDRGLTLAKTYRHRPGFRGLVLELELLLAADATRSEPECFLDLLGPELINPSESSVYGNPAVAIAVAGDGAHGVVHPVSPKPGVVDANKQELLTLPAGELAFAGSTNRFFAGFLYPLDDAAHHAVTRVDAYSRPLSDDPITKTKAFSTTTTQLTLQMQLPKPGSSTKASFGVYLGPKSYHTFAEQPEYERFLPIMDVDLEPGCCFSISIPGGKFMAGLLVRLLGWFHSVVGNWGIAVMMLTVLVRGLLAPVNFRMQKSMRVYGQKMAKLQPMLQKLKEKYGADKNRYQQEMVAFQREHKMLPPLGGCLPIFLTMPIYLGLFTALRTAYDLRHQPFVSWINDLSQPDQLFDLGFFPHHFNLLPLLWMAMLVRMQLKMPLPTDPQQRQVQQMMRYMPLVFGVVLYNYASGLMLYMVTSMVWTMIESRITKKILGPLDPNVAAMAPTPTF